MPIEQNVEQVEELNTGLPPDAPETVDTDVDQVRPDGPGSGRSQLRKALEKGFADERTREEKTNRGRQRTARAADQYKEETGQAEGTEDPQAAAEQNQAGPPEAFSREAKAEWANVPPTVQQAILKREQDSARGVQELKQRYSELDTALAPRLDVIKQHGHSPAGAVNQLFAWFDSLGEDATRIRNGQPPIAFTQLAKSYGIDPVQAFWPAFQEYMQTYAQRVQAQRAQQAQQQPQQGGQPEVPEQLQPFYQHLAQLNQRQQQLEQFYNQKLGSLESNFQAQSQAKTDEMLANWARDKPYYEDVRQMMARMIASHAVPPLPNGSADLDKAYEMAVYALPEVRQRVLADQAAKDEATRQEKVNAEKKAREEAAAKARKAAGSLAPNAPGADIVPGKRKGTGKSVRASLMEAWEDSRR